MIILVFAFSLISAIGWHMLPVRFYLLSILGSVITTVMIVWLVGSSHMTNTDTFFVTCIAFFVTLIVGFSKKKLTIKKSDGLD